MGNAFFYIFFFLIIQDAHLHDFNRSDWLDTLVTRTSSQFKHSQTVIFTNGNEDNDIPQQNSIIARLMRESSLIAVKLQKITEHEKNRLFGLSIFQYPRSIALYVILLRDHNSKALSETVTNILELIINLSPVPTRPRCMLMLFNRDSDILKTEYDYLNKILVSAWKLKFLDFTIVKISEKTGNMQKPIIYYYNPFTGVIHSENLNSTTAIFPDKLIDMNNYSFKVPVYNYPSLMTLEKDFTKSKPQIRSYEDTYLYIFSKKLNFSPELHLQTCVPADPTFFQKIFKKFKSGELNMMATQFLVGTILFNNSVVLGRMHSQTQFRIVAPVLPIEKSNLTKEIIIYLALFPSIVIIYVVTIRVMKLSDGEWKTVCILKALLGVPEKKMPSRLTTRVIYLNLLLLSVKYSSDAFSRLTDVKCIKGEQIFDTAEEILKQGFYVYIPPSIQKQSYNDTTEFIRMIKPKLKIMSHVDCTKELIKKKDRFCLTPDPTSKYLVDTAYAKYRKRIIKLTKATDLKDYAAFTYEKGSPYVEKFDKIQQRLIEAGIEESYMKQERRKFYMEDDEEDKAQDLLATQLYLILSICYAICILVFIREILENFKKWRPGSLRQSILPKLSTIWS
ncbi:hypothetical protein QAD02_015025 [Eretmocerus hayati]|uniref:Uncharacterized protein n=1 Tax=Eretmocerus hayati TaxID=131215 RepID=A0ACC2P772_9HYME|nr:hypothetical protein QAD02_015025 [Eretmocerus hayati]